MIEATVGALSALSGLVSLGEKLISAKSETDKQKLLIEFQRSIIAAQGETMSLQNQLASARADIERLTNDLLAKRSWADQRAQFALRQVAEGIHCFVDKDAEGAPEVMRKYCPNCMERGRLSLLATLPSKAYYEGVSLVCNDPACKASFDAWGFMPAIA